MPDVVDSARKVGDGDGEREREKERVGVVETEVENKGVQGNGERAVKEVDEIK